MFESFPRVFQILCWDFCLKPTSEQAGIGLRRENFGIPESKILEPSFLPKKAFFYIFHYFFDRFSIYVAASAAKYCEKGLAAIGKSFGKGLGRFWKS